MAVGFIVSGMGGGGTPPPPDVGQEILQPVPDSAEDTEVSTDATETDAPVTEGEDASADQ